MYPHARETDGAEIRRRIIEQAASDQAPAVEIAIRLAYREHTLRFVGTHWFDLKTVLGSVNVKVGEADSRSSPRPLGERGGG
jgi:hypothetical protein